MSSAELKSQIPNPQGKCKCDRCGKVLAENNFYAFKDGTLCSICKPCLTAHVDNFDSSTFEWILEKMDVPYIPTEWNVLRDRAFAKNPYKMNGLSVLGKYLSKMRLQQWKKYTYKDSEAIQQQMFQNEWRKAKDEQQQAEKYEKQLKELYQSGEISEAEYKTLLSTEVQKKQLPKRQLNVITGAAVNPSLPTPANNNTTEPQSYEAALAALSASSSSFAYDENKYMSESELVDLGENLTQQDKLYLAMKWGRLYTPNQWVTLEQLYNEFIDSFDIQGAARKDTLKKICKTSLKMDEAIDSGDIDSYQKLSRVYDQMMKAARFTEAQNKDQNDRNFDAVGTIVDYVQKRSGVIPKYSNNVPEDIMDVIISDLKEYTKNLIYEDKSLAQQIESYLEARKRLDAEKAEKEAAFLKKQKTGMIIPKETQQELEEEKMTGDREFYNLEQIEKKFSKRPPQDEDLSSIDKKINT